MGLVTIAQIYFRFRNYSISIFSSPRFWCDPGWRMGSKSSEMMISKYKILEKKKKMSVGHVDGCVRGAETGHWIGLRMDLRLTWDTLGLDIRFDMKWE